MLSRNPKGYFLMVEWDTHTDNVRRGLDRMVADRPGNRADGADGRRRHVDALHRRSFVRLRVRGGDPRRPLLDGLDQAEAQAVEETSTDMRIPAPSMENSHTGEEVLVAAQGPGAERVRGYLANTDLFGIMMDAFGWKAN